MITALVAVVATLGVAGAAERDAHPVGAVLAGGSDPGTWAVSASAGFPWLAARGQLGLKGGWTPIVEAQVGSFRRYQPAAGVGLRWIDARWRLGGEALFGWLFQTGTLARKGPSGELRLRGGRAVGVLQPYAFAGTKHSLLITEVTVVTAQGNEVSYRPGHEWTLTGGLGLGLALGERWGLDLGLDLPWVDVPGVSIPGIHLGVVAGGGR